ncbi:MAG: hypothetical protein KGV59_01335 [Tenacibaculum sp.]|nr:hypothetical protein [Tenacibaculum sp.]
MSYKYSLEKGSKKYNCPQCRKKTFVRYIDKETDNYLDYKYGRCDRENKCKYHLNPYKDGLKINNTIKYYDSKPKNKVFIPNEILETTLKGYSDNTFINNLLGNFPVAKVEEVISMYYLGTITKDYMKGAITFPFIDINNNVRAIQVKQFDAENHTIKTSFLHSIIKNDLIRGKNTIPQWLKNYDQQDLKVSCLFGEHLLKLYPYHYIGLVEAPKTAIYNTLYLGSPKESNFIWLAVYNKSSLNFQKCKVLEDRKVVLFPDLSNNGDTFKEWETKAYEIQSKLKNATFKVSDLLEKTATEKQKEEGLDMADFFNLLL